MNTHHALDVLVCGYAQPIRSEKVIVIMGAQPLHVAYVDESGGGKANRILLLSACIHRYDAWALFSDEWKAVLDQSPAIPAFHMRQARSRQGAFAGLTQIEVDHKIISLTEVLLKYRPRIISCSVREPEYAETIRVSGPPDFRHAYFLCFVGIVNKVAEYCYDLGVKTPIDYVFDEHGDIGREAQLLYPVIKASFPSHIQALMGGTPVFRDDEQVLPLQAADLVAWHKRREKTNPGLDSERAASMRIDELDGAELDFGRHQLEDMSKKVSEVFAQYDDHDTESQFKLLKKRMRKQQRRIASGGK